MNSSDAKPRVVENEKLSVDILNHIEAVKENANTLDSNLNKLIDSYFGIANKENEEKLIANGFSSIVHNELDNFNKIILKALDFTNRL